MPFAHLEALEFLSCVTLARKVRRKAFKTNDTDYRKNPHDRFMRRMKSANSGVNSYPELNVDANKAHCHGVKVRPFSPHKGCATYAIGFTPSRTMAAGGWQHNVQKGRLFENGIIQQKGASSLSRCSGHPPLCFFSRISGILNGARSG